MAELHLGRTLDAIDLAVDDGADEAAEQDADEALDAADYSDEGAVGRIFAVLRHRWGV